MMMLKRPMKVPLLDTILSVLCVRYRNSAASQEYGNYYPGRNQRRRIKVEGKNRDEDSDTGDRKDKFPKGAQRVKHCARPIPMTNAPITNGKLPGEYIQSASEMQPSDLHLCR